MSYFNMFSKKLLTKEKYFYQWFIIGMNLNVFFRIFFFSTIFFCYFLVNLCSHYFRYTEENVLDTKIPFINKSQTEISYVGMSIYM